MASRYGISIGIAIAITFGLLFIMQLLVASGRGDTKSHSPINWLELVRVERNMTPERTREKPPKPPEPTERPELPNATAESTGTAILAVSVTAPELGNGFEVGGLGMASRTGNTFLSRRSCRAIPFRRSEPVSRAMPSSSTP